MMRTILFACLTVPFLFAATSATAAEINGAWANSAEACGKIFVKTSGRTDFAPDADLNGSGFIIDGNQIRGKMARCNVKMRKEDGELVHFVATCSTDVAVETMQFTVKVSGADKISRVFPGLPELETPYVRCSGF